MTSKNNVARFSYRANGYPKPERNARVARGKVTKKKAEACDMHTVSTRQTEMKPSHSLSLHIRILALEQTQVHQVLEEYVQFLQTRLAGFLATPVSKRLKLQDDAMRVLVAR